MKKILFLIILIPLIFNNFGCSSQKKKVVEYYKKYYEYLDKSHELDYTKQIEEIDKIAKSFGYKDAMEAGMDVQKFSDEPEIKELQAKIDKVDADLRSEREKKAQDELRKLEEQQKLIQQNEQKSNSKDSSNKNANSD